MGQSHLCADILGQVALGLAQPHIQQVRALHYRQEDQAARICVHDTPGDAPGEMGGEVGGQEEARGQYICPEDRGVYRRIYVSQV